MSDRAVCLTLLLLAVVVVGVQPHTGLNSNAGHQGLITSSPIAMAASPMNADVAEDKLNNALQSNINGIRRLYGVRPVTPTAVAPKQHAVVKDAPIVHIAPGGPLGLPEAIGSTSSRPIQDTSAGVLPFNSNGLQPTVEVRGGVSSVTAHEGDKDHVQPNENTETEKVHHILITPKAQHQSHDSGHSHHHHHGEDSHNHLDRVDVPSHNELGMNIEPAADEEMTHSRNHTAGKHRTSS